MVRNEYVAGMRLTEVETKIAFEHPFGYASRSEIGWMASTRQKNEHAQEEQTHQTREAD